AKEVLVERESEGLNVVSSAKEVKVETNANVAEIINVLKDTDMNNISPLMAFGTLQNLVDKVISVVFSTDFVVILNFLKKIFYAIRVS
ncbi:MAG: hypothetical protein IJX22_04580, partial [Opitutales bacterium]|nr:hypothetical protein [Opitutales bacterium]